MSARFLSAVSLVALVSACSSQPGPSSLSPAQQADEAYRAGNFAVAEQTYAGLLSVNPSNPTAMLGLAEVYEATGRTSEAAQLYARVAAARSGSIRVWNDGGALQDGVTEVAMRRLGELGHGSMMSYAAPIVSAPMAYAAPAPTEYWPEDPVYALDQDGIVYFADPEATQPIRETLFDSPEAAMMAAPTMAAPVMTAPTMSAPMAYTPAPVTYEPAPVAYQPAPISYETMPMAVESAPVTYQAAPMMEPAPVYTPAPIGADYTSAPITYEAAPMIEPVPAAYAPVPASMTYQAAPMVAPAYTPEPVALRAPTAAASLPRDQPGYAVVDGNFVYISAQDIARGATAPSPVANVENALGYGVPTPVTSSAIPVGTPQSYSAPRGVDVMNGIPMIDLN